MTDFNSGMLTHAPSPRWQRQNIGALYDPRVAANGSVLYLQAKISS